jgi:hypothetical protein
MKKPTPIRAIVDPLIYTSAPSPWDYAGTIIMPKVTLYNRDYKRIAKT